MILSDPPHYTDKALETPLQWLVQSQDLLFSNRPAPDRALLYPTKLADNRIVKLPRRVGLQFEQLVYEYLKLTPDVSDIQRNIQIKTDGKTLGELDFIYRTSAGWFHLETAVKFYLRLGRSTDLSDWVGPNLKDNLGKKWVHMRDHQTLLTQRTDCQEQLSRMGIKDPETQLWVKGWLFSHPTQVPLVSVPYPINPAHPRGWWIRRSEMQRFLPSFANRFVLPGKPNWLTPASVYRGIELSVESTASILSNLHQPQHLWAVSGTGVSRQIISRGFVVPDNWAED